MDVMSVITDANKLARERDQTPDADSLIAQIVETGYFGDTTAAEIAEICKAATTYSQGYLLLPAGEFVGHPIGRAWTTNGYLEGEYVALDATHDSVEIAADSLLRAITPLLDTCSTMGY